MSVPGALEALLALSKAANDAVSQAGVPRTTIALVHHRASQINRCAVRLDLACRAARKHGQRMDDRLVTLVAWQETGYFDDAERAALALTEAATRLSDRESPVPDEIW